MSLNIDLYVDHDFLNIIACFIQLEKITARKAERQSLGQ